MPKIKKSPPKRLQPPAPKLHLFISNALAASDTDLIPLLSLPQWPHGKVDMYHFIALLDRMDALLSSAIQQGFFACGLQSVSWTVGVRDLVLAMLHFTRILMENSTNRSIYNSQPHLRSLLGTSDLKVLEQLMWLVLRQVQRYTASPRRSAVGEMSTLFGGERILSLIEAWGQHGQGFAVNKFYQSNASVAGSLKFQFYRSATDKPELQSSSSGSVQVKIPAISSSDQLWTTYQSMLTEYTVPEKHQLTLFHMLRFSDESKLSQPEFREKVLIVRLLAISIYANITPEITTDRLMSIKEPTLITDLADLLNIDNHVPYGIQTAALNCLESFCAYSGKIGQVLAALNASANHGILMFILRQVLAGDSSTASKYPNDFVDALMSLLSILLASNIGGNMITGAGVIDVLVQSLHDQSSDRVKTLTRSVAILDNLLYAFGQIFNSFFQTDGTTIIVARIDAELQNCLTVVSSDLIPHDTLTFIKTMLRFILHTMQTASTSDRVRNLIDSTLTKSIKTVMSQPKLFGPIVYALSLSLMSTFLHNEPTTYAALQENGVPDVFLDSICGDIPASPDVLNAVPHAIGAICLNVQGMEKVVDVKPFDNFFKILHSPEHLRGLLDDDMATFLGQSIDELVRHHPALRESIMQSLVSAFKGVLAECQSGSEVAIGSVEDRVKWTYHLKTGPKDAEPVKMVDSTIKPEDPEDPPGIQYIEVICRVIEGLLQNSSHTESFAESGGMSLLLDVYSLPYLPYDFGTSSASSSFASILTVLGTHSCKLVLVALMDKFETAFKDASGFLYTLEKKSSWSHFVNVSDDNLEIVAIANTQFQKLIAVQNLAGLLCDVYGVQMSPKHSSEVLEIFATDQGWNVIKALSHLYRYCALESLYLKADIPPEWLLVRPPAPEKKPEGILTAEQKKIAEEDAKPRADTTDFRVRNARMMKYLLAQTTAFIVPTFGSICKVITLTRRSDEKNRSKANKIASQFATSIAEHLTWARIPTDLSPISFQYMRIMVSLLQTALTDERTPAHLMTIVAVEFDKLGGLELILDLARKMIFSIVEIRQNPLVVAPVLPDESEQVKEQRGTLMKANGTIEEIFEILQLFVSLPTLDTPHTIFVSGRDLSIFNTKRSSKSSTGDKFNPRHFLVRNRKVILNALSQLWNDNIVFKCPSNIIKSLVAVFVATLHAEGEVSPVVKPIVEKAPVEVAPVADSTQLTALMEMGFPREACVGALARYGQNLGRAAEYLLMHPPVEEVVPPVVVPAAVETPSTLASADAAAPSASTDVAPMEIVADAVSDDGNAEFEDVADPMDEDHDDTDNEVPSDEDDNESVDPFPEPLAVDANQAVVLNGPDYEELQKLRQNILEKGVERCVAVMEQTPDSIFAIKDLLLQILSNKTLSDSCNTNPTEVFAVKCSELLKALHLGADIQAVVTTKLCSPSLKTRLHLLAAMINDSTLQNNLSVGIEELVPSLISLLAFLSNESANLSATDRSACLASTMLTVECFMSLSEQPHAAELTIAPENRVNAGLNLKLPVLRQLGLDEKTKLLDSLLALLPQNDVDSSALHSIFRLLLRLTRDFEIADMFALKGGIPVIIDLPSNRSFTGQLPLVMIIVRHVMESPIVLRALMEQEIVNWFTPSMQRVRGVDVPQYLKAMAAAVTRNPAVFVEATLSSCRLTSSEPVNRQFQITNRKEDPKNDNLMDVMFAKPAKNVADDTLNKQHKLMHGNIIASDLTSKVVRFLLQKLVSGGTSNPTSPMSPTPSAADLAVLLKKQHDNQVQRCFILQTLSEMTDSFPPCKLHVLGMTKAGSSDVRAIIMFILKDMIPYNSINEVSGKTQPAEEKHRINASNWATHLLASLASGYVIEFENKTSLESDTTGYAALRRVVVECISETMVSLVSSTEPLHAKYGKYHGIADLIHKMLNCKFLSIPEQPSKAIAKCMIDVGIVHFLSQVLGTLDVHFPNVRTLMNALLRCLETLGRLGNAISREALPTAPATPVERKPSTLLDQVTGAKTDSTALFGAHGNESFVRNSALGMYSADDMSSGSSLSDSEMDSQDMDGNDMMEEDTDDDDGMDQDDFTDVSDESSESDLDDDSAFHGHGDDLEVVVRPTFRDNDEGNSDSDSSSNDSHVDLPPIDPATVDDDDGNSDWADEAVVNAEGDDFDEHSSDPDDDDDDGHDHDDDDDNPYHGEIVFGDGDGNDDVSDDYEMEDFEADEDGNPFFGGRNGRRGRVNGRRSRDVFEIEVGGNNPHGMTAPMMINDLLGNVQQRIPILGIPANPASDQVTVHPLLDPSAHTNRVHDGNHIMGAIFDPDATRAASRPAPGSSSLRDIGVDMQFVGGNTATGVPANMNQMLAGNAAGILERMLSSVVPGNVSIQFDNSGANGNSLRLSSVLATQRFGAMAGSSDFKPCRTMDRWWHETNMVYGKSTVEVASRLQNTLLNAMVPVVIEKEKRKAEEVEKAAEAKRLEEEEKKKAEELVNKQKEDEEISKLEAEKPVQPEAMDTAPMDVVDAAPSSSSAAPATSITIHGTVVDLTNSGIDPAFLEALPEEMRAEVLAQHFRDQGLPNAQMFTDEISNDFLNALPDDIREEIMQQEAMNAANNGNEEASPANDIFGRQNLMEFEDAARGVTDFMNALNGRPRVNALVDKAAEASAEAKKNCRKDPAKLVDSSSLMPLIKLLFLNQTLNRSHLFSIISQVAENSAVRSELFFLLLNIIQECCLDNSMAAPVIDRKGKGPATPRKNSVASTLLQQINVDGNTEGFNRMAVQRSLDICIHLAGSQTENTSRFFLTENPDSIILKPSKNNKKPKNRMTPVRYPVLILLSLLERPLFLQTSSLMDVLTQLIALVSKPLSTVGGGDKKKAVKEEVPAAPPQPDDNDELLDAAA